ncbi:Late embryogenesis abundant (LEA) hydroxyproline-rich glycoprotein family [Zea mays]|uniref:Late embryogenesis abundant (LEA) hydroxyproline-rich glycoprotein family n=2 Tax=Zea mays TaxID=4577 RepID=A0A1D6L0B3_MAIZE|nr:Late embryogenesis abundant (LEA) hydroxyproline-rich glycoprotein family [Zea mays]
MAKTTQPTAGMRDPLLPTSTAASPPPYLDPHPADSYTYTVFLVPVRLRRGLCRGGRCIVPCLTVLFLLALAGFLLWPADPDISLARLHLAHVSVVARPAVAVTISATLKVRVRNPDLFALDYTRLDVAIGYRGAGLGRVTSGGGRVRARAVSYVDANLQLDGIRVVEDAMYLLEDLAQGSVPFDTIAEVEGHLHFLFLSIPVKGRISCVMHINPHNQTIVHQDCYPEVSNCKLTLRLTELLKRLTFSLLSCVSELLMAWKCGRV